MKNYSGSVYDIECQKLPKWRSETYLLMAKACTSVFITEYKGHLFAIFWEPYFLIGQDGSKYKNSPSTGFCMPK